MDLGPLSVDEWQLLSFFESRPEYPHPDEQWPDSDAIFTIRDSDLELSFAIHPVDRNVRLIIQCRGQRIYELNAMDVKDVRYSHDQWEILEIVLSDCESLSFRIKPHIELRQSVDNRL